MKKIYSFVIAVAISVSANVFAQTTYVWDCTSVNPVSGANANISTVSFAATQGNNNGTTTLITSASVSAGYAGASGTSNFGAAAFKETLNTSTSTYFSVTVNPASGYKVNLGSLSFGSRGTSTGPGVLTVYSSIDNYGTPIGTAAVNNNSTWALVNITFTGSNLIGATSTPVTLRIYGSDSAGAATPSAGTANWRIDDISLTVTATAGTLAVSDLSKTKGSFIKNTFVKNEEITFGAQANDVKVYNMFGQVVKTASVKENGTLNVAELQKGNYIVTGTVNNQPVSQKILKD
jgi:hypothetical protein